MDAVIWLVNTAASLYFWLLIAQVAMSWLAHLKIVDTRHPVVYRIGDFLWRVTEPVLGPIRRFLNRIVGDLGGIDVSPIVALVGVEFLRRVVVGEILTPLR